MKVAIYCRLSEEDKNKQNETDDSGSIQNQKSMLLQYAMDKQWEVYNIYSDDDYAGADRNRPAFKQLLEDAENRKFDIVLCKTQSRFTRELELVEKYIHGLFPKWGIRFVSIVDNADTENRGNKKARQINGLINEWYLEDMSENIKSVLTNRRKNGFHIGAFALYGYQKDPDLKGHLIVDEEAAKIVKEVFTLFAQGYGKTNIAKVLNDRGIPNPTEYKRLQNLRYKAPESKQSTLWKYFAISDMLSNEMYIGNMVQGKYGSVSYKTKENKPLPKEQWIRVENTHEPIIDRELWNQVQAMIQQKTKPFITGEIGIFAKKAKCMYCGYTMRSSKSRGRHYLKCESRHVAKNACIGSFASVRELEGTVVTELRDLIAQYLDYDQLEGQITVNDEWEIRCSELEAQAKQYQKKQDDYSKSLRELYMDKIRGVISEQQFIDFSREFSSEKGRLEEVIKAIQCEIELLEQKINAPINRAKIIEEYTDIIELNRVMVETLIDHVVVGKRNPETKELPIEIHWNF